ncbi:MAG TPA: carboxypeptidase regulatory-like domain-containing protein [Verrucomicrobiae bacterium]|jgi:plastocyanin
MKVFFSLSLYFAVAMSSFAGTLSGTVKAQPKPELAEAPAGGAKYDSRQFKFVEKIKYDQIKDFIVYIEGAMTNITFATPAKDVITQKDAMFHPHVMPIVVGTEVRWPNKDDIFHNVFSISDAKNFDLGLYKDPDVGKVTFDKAGRVDVFCSIHSQMNCVILVLQNPFFAATDSKGAYRITNIPAGTYKVKAWHERLPGQAKEITIPEEGEVHEDFVVGVANLTK